MSVIKTNERKVGTAAPLRFAGGQGDNHNAGNALLKLLTLSSRGGHAHHLNSTKKQEKTTFNIHYSYVCVYLLDGDSLLLRSRVKKLENKIFPRRIGHGTQGKSFSRKVLPERSDPVEKWCKWRAKLPRVRLRSS